MSDLPLSNPAVDNPPASAPSRTVAVLLMTLAIGGLLAFILNLVIGGLAFLAIILLPIVAFSLRGAVGHLRRLPRAGWLVLASVLPAVLVALLLVAGQFFLLLLPQYASAIVNGPNVIHSARSPDGQFEAYVVDRPCIDGPAHALYVERSDGLHFIQIADLPEDIDAVEKIVWSPSGDMVVFQTRFAIIIANVPTYETVKIPLGIEWSRSKAGRGSTFCTGGPRRTVQSISFPTPGVLAYRLDTEADARTVRMRDL